MFLAVPVGILVKLVAMTTWLYRKPYDFFLCHYKLESGAISRLLPIGRISRTWTRSSITSARALALPSCCRVVHS